ncbi:unnamed protein product [Paramecium pentaurelia]|uniref:PPC domain-containing protein n=1 Tax=Paramecium pentaurelia TaxID=43138 RepID=A0A8S1TVL7_9CILI|nr:unnamed protein product [Paramecium pentaurelia]
MIIILSIFFAIIQANSISEIRSHTLRLRPNQNIVKELQQYIETNQIKAASISTCVGSLLKCSIRFANQPQFTEINGHFEIVSLVGTISVYGQHIHISLSDTEGKMIGGHLPFYDNECIIYTTAEIVLLEHIDTIYARKLDPTYGYYELYII